jgi:DNA-binding NarL/FixJ family response regulator
MGHTLELDSLQLATILADTLDQLAAAVLLVDVDARVVHANVAGRAMLADADLLPAASGRLCAGTLTKILRDVLTAAGAGKASVASRSAAIGLFARDGQRFVATVIPLALGARGNGGTPYSAVAAVFVRKAEVDLPMPIEVVANLYKLTPAQTRILLAIVKDGGGVPQVAAALGISKTTVKTHLHQVFAKTQTTRQVDLVKLVAGFMTPQLANHQIALADPA